MAIGNTVTVELGATVSKFRCVDMPAGGKAIESTDPTVAGAKTILGVLQQDGVSGDLRAIVTQGRTTAIAGAALAAGTDMALMVDSLGANGRLIPAVSGGLNYAVARWLPDPNNLTPSAGEQITVELLGGQYIY